jgi:hypothetical protein
VLLILAPRQIATTKSSTIRRSVSVGSAALRPADHTSSPLAGAQFAAHAPAGIRLCRKRIRQRRTCACPKAAPRRSSSRSVALAACRPRRPRRPRRQPGPPTLALTSRAPRHSRVQWSDRQLGDVGTSKAGLHDGARRRLHYASRGDDGLVAASHRVPSVGSIRRRPGAWGEEPTCALVAKGGRDESPRRDKAAPSSEIPSRRVTAPTKLVAACYDLFRLARRLLPKGERSK